MKLSRPLRLPVEADPSWRDARPWFPPATLGVGIDETVNDLPGKQVVKGTLMDDGSGRTHGLGHPLRVGHHEAGSRADCLEDGIAIPSHRDGWATTSAARSQTLTSSR